MSKNIAFKGTPVFNATDAHFNGQVIVPVSGVIQSGAATVFTNDLETAIANSTKHTHVACPGENNFSLESGQSKVYAEDSKVVRIGDPTNHCGSAPPFGSKGQVLPFGSPNTFC